MRWLRLFLSIRMVWALFAVILGREVPWRALSASVSLLALAVMMTLPILLLGCLTWLVGPPLLDEYRMARRIARHRATREMEREMGRKPSLLSGCPHCKRGKQTYYDHDDFPMQVMPVAYDDDSGMLAVARRDDFYDQEDWVGDE